jgi:vanillate O-demethylase ferredoxin subunit
MPDSARPAGAAPADGGFEIYLAWSERVVRVAPGESALSALIAAGVPIDPGCQTGACGECVTPYVEGDIVHKDSCLNDELRQRSFCPCVSRAQSRIVLAY